MNKTMAVIVVLVLGLVVGSLVMGGGVSVLESGSNETSQAYDAGEESTDKGSCYSSCRLDNPASGTQYRECKANRCE